MRNGYPRTDSYYDRVIAMQDKLKKASDPDGEPDWQDDTAEPVPCYQLILGDDVTTSYGGCHIEVVSCDDSVMSTVFKFDVSLGPVNAQKLIDFLKTLPEEPDGCHERHNKSWCTLDAGHEGDHKFEES